MSLVEIGTDIAAALGRSGRPGRGGEGPWQTIRERFREEAAAVERRLEAWSRHR